MLKTGNRYLLLTCCLLLILPVISAIAGDAPKKESEVRIHRTGKFDRARQLIKIGNYAAATDLLELLRSKNQSNPALNDLLASCYEKTDNYEKLLLLLQNRIQSEPPNFLLLRDFGRAHLLSGHTDSARIYFFQAAHLSDGVPGALNYMAVSYDKLGHYELEAEFIDSARIIFDDPYLLAGRMGDALAAQKMFSRATIEYLNYIDSDSLVAREGSDKIIAMIEYPESVDTVMAVLSEKIRQQSNNPQLLNMYGRILLEQDRYDEAYAFFREKDSVENKTGGEILFFMRECNRREKYGYVLEAGNYLIDRHPESGLELNARFSMAEACTALGKYDEALNNYNIILDRFKRTSEKAETRLKIGLLYKDCLGNLEEAKKYLKEVIRAVGRSRYGTEALFGLADLYVKEQKLDSAIVHYDSLLQREMPDDLAEKAEYLLGQACLFKQKYEEATKHFRRLINSYPRGFYVNEAIQYSLILRATLEPSPKHIDLFSSAEYFRYIEQVDSLEYYLTKICRIGLPTLAPRSYLHLADLYCNQKRHNKAVAAIDSLTALYPESYYLPFGLKSKADILWLKGETKERALALYRNLLEKYGTYPFAAEIRDILRRESEINQI